MYFSELPILPKAYSFFVEAVLIVLLLGTVTWKLAFNQRNRPELLTVSWYCKYSPTHARRHCCCAMETHFHRSSRRVKPPRTVRVCLTPSVRLCMW